jgi:hypothetical protein
MPLPSYYGTDIPNISPGNRAMTGLDARENNIGDEGKRALQQAGGSRWGTYDTYI